MTADAVAKIGETGYETLAAALAAMQDGDTVTLLKDVEESFTLETNGTIDLGDFSITGVVVVQANVTFVGGSVNQGDIFVGGEHNRPLELEHFENGQVFIDSEGRVRK